MISSKSVCIILFLAFLPLANLFAMDEGLTLEDSLNFLKSRLPEDFPENATFEILSMTSGISFYNKKIKDEDFKFLAPLCRLDNIKTLDFSCHELTGSGLKELFNRCGQWNSVTRLDLGSNPLEEEFLEYLKMFPNLVQLNIDFHIKTNGPKSLVDGSFLKKIKLEKLILLEAGGINLSDENALELLNWHSLEAFNFWGTNLTESCLLRLRQERADMALKCWDLQRIKFGAQHPFHMIPEPNDTDREKMLKLAFDLVLLSKEAFEWAVENKITVSLCIGRHDDERLIFGACFPNGDQK